jgi:hypothetical protein
MPGKGKSMSQVGHGGGNKREGQDGAIGQHRDATPSSTDGGALGRGRSESSPGHLKRAAGAQSASEFAPGRTGKTGRGTALPEAAPDEMAED